MGLPPTPRFQKAFLLLFNNLSLEGQIKAYHWYVEVDIEKRIGSKVIFYISSSDFISFITGD